MTWNRLKLIAIVSMLIDHIAKVLLPQTVLVEHFGMDFFSSYVLLQCLQMIGRIAFPIFAYGIAQGCIYTHNFKHYLLRLALFAVISEIPYNLAFHSGSIFFKYFDFNNIFFTLLLGAICCYLYQICFNKSKRWIAFLLILPLILIAGMLEFEYGSFGILFILIPYIFRKTKRTQLISLGIVSIIFYLFVSQYNGIPGSWFQWMVLDNLSLFTFTDTIGALAGVFMLALYNGEKGKYYHKWLFYLFYPLHLLVLVLFKFMLYI